MVHMYLCGCIYADTYASHIVTTSCNVSWIHTVSLLCVWLQRTSTSMELAHPVGVFPITPSGKSLVSEVTV